MRIERIRRPKDFAMWVVDQAGHVALGSIPGAVLASALYPLQRAGMVPDWWGGPAYLVACLGGLLILSHRELSQWEGKARGPAWRRDSLIRAAWWARRLGTWTLYLDPVLDVVIGTAGVAAIWSWML